LISKLGETNERDGTNARTGAKMRRAVPGLRKQQDFAKIRGKILRQMRLGVILKDE